MLFQLAQPFLMSFWCEMFFMMIVAKLTMCIFKITTQLKEILS